MIVDIFTLCDSAKEYQGKLVIVGTFNTISAIQFPATHPELAIVARIVMGNLEKGKHTLKISIKKENEDAYLVNPFNMDIDNSNLQTEVGNLNLIFNVNNLLIPSAGKYVVTLEIGELVKESTLYVVTVKQ